MGEKVNYAQAGHIYSEPFDSCASNYSRSETNSPVSRDYPPGLTPPLKPSPSIPVVASLPQDATFSNSSAKAALPMNNLTAGTNKLTANLLDGESTTRSNKTAERKLYKTRKRNRKPTAVPFDTSTSLSSRYSPDDTAAADISPSSANAPASSTAVLSEPSNCERAATSLHNAERADVLNFSSAIREWFVPFLQNAAGSAPHEQSGACSICCETLTYSCNCPCCQHSLCWLCCVRLRFLNNFRICPFCQTKIKGAFLTHTRDILSDEVQTDRFAAIDESLTYPSLGLIFEDVLIKQAVALLFELRCWFPTCRAFWMAEIQQRVQKFTRFQPVARSEHFEDAVCAEEPPASDKERESEHRVIKYESGITYKHGPFPSIQELQNHLKKRHGRFICQICYNMKPLIFRAEHKYYLPDALKKHIREGDLTGEIPEEPHPLCSICNERFLSVESFYMHVSFNHFICNICMEKDEEDIVDLERILSTRDAEYGRESSSQRRIQNCLNAKLFKDLNQLNLHNKTVHFPCPYGCQLTAFRSRFHLEVHVAMRHKDTYSGKGLRLGNLLTYSSYRGDRQHQRTESRQSERNSRGLTGESHFSRLNVASGPRAVNTLSSATSYANHNEQVMESNAMTSEGTESSLGTVQTYTARKSTVPPNIRLSKHATAADSATADSLVVPSSGDTSVSFYRGAGSGENAVKPSVPQLDNTQSAALPQRDEETLRFVDALHQRLTATQSVNEVVLDHDTESIIRSIVAQRTLADVSNLSCISKDLSGWISTKYIEECQALVPEYYRLHQSANLSTVRTMKWFERTEEMFAKFTDRENAILYCYVSAIQSLKPAMKNLSDYPSLPQTKAKDKAISAVGAGVNNHNALSRTGAQNWKVNTSRSQKKFSREAFPPLHGSGSKSNDASKVAVWNSATRSNDVEPSKGSITLQSKTEECRNMSSTTTWPQQRTADEGTHWPSISDHASKEAANSLWKKAASSTVEEAFACPKCRFMNASSRSRCSLCNTLLDKSVINIDLKNFRNY